ncbi:ABC transporter permease subunit, partial [Streptomyces sp. NPDC001193]
MSSVLYDTPGPKAKTRNWVYTGIFLVVIALVLWWALSLMAEKNQLDADKWSPFVTDSQVWTTYLLPGLGETLKAGLIAMVIALPLGALLGIARLSDHAWIRVPVGTVVEFFRAIPVLMLMFFSSALYVMFGTVSSDLRPLYAVVTGLVLYNASVIAEIVRAGTPPPRAAARA